MKGVTTVRTDSLHVECPSDRRIYVQIDGEYAGRLPASLKIVPRSLSLLMPPSFREHYAHAKHG
jgi:diacylglycerol kinase family enzyme